MSIRTPDLSSRVPSARRLLAVLLASLLLFAMPAAATAQTLMQDPQTKEQAQQAAKAADSTTTSSSDSSDKSVQIGLLVLGGVVLVAAAWFILRDSSDSVRDRSRPAPGRPVDAGAVGRGAPKTMFTGEAEPGGKVGKRKKRTQGKRQRNARKANRPR